MRIILAYSGTLETSVAIPWLVLVTTGSAASTMAVRSVARPRSHASTTVDLSCVSPLLSRL